MSSKWLLLLQNLAFFSIILFQLQLRFAYSNNMRCIDEEKEALLTFKQGLVDESGVLSSWGRGNCCHWRGVRCSNTTGHVNALTLKSVLSDGFPGRALKGTISSALLKLRDLRHLDLSGNDFSRSRIPEFIGSLSKLRYLSLCYAEFEGPIPPHLGNLSRLHYLDLGGNTNLFSSGNLDWLSRLSSLRYLNLEGNNLSKSSDWFQLVGQLHSLKALYLSLCFLPPINSSLFISHLNFSYTSIQNLSLSFNNLNSSVYPWLFNVSSKLVYLDLRYNQLKGPIPEDFKHMFSLKSLELDYNKLEGGIPKFFGNMSSLSLLYLGANKLSGALSEFIQNLSGRCTQNSLEMLHLYENYITGPLPDFGGFSSLKQLFLSYNRLNGTINKSLSHLYKLEVLSLSGNSFTGIITENFFSNLSNLKLLDLSGYSLALKLSPDWVPPFQLNYIRLVSCKIGPYFPKWLQTQNQIKLLDISNNGISDVVPDWFWDKTSELSFLNLSNNQIKGEVPNLSSIFDRSGYEIDISSNHFEGLIPPLPSNATILNLSKNKFSGSISFICSISGYLLEYLDLSNNLLSGMLPDCWIQFDRLIILNLANNIFSGEIPKSLGFLSQIQTLSFYNNNLIGELPSLLKNCSQLMFMDLGNNALSGEIPTWIGEGLLKLIVLRLKSNKFYGNIPFQLCHLASIQILDLSLNNISGVIPKCFNNFTAMTKDVSSNFAITSYYAFVVRGFFYPFTQKYLNNAVLIWKGSEYEYSRTLGLLKVLDISSNKLCGAIPKEIMHLVGLIALNISRNNLTGHIPPNIGQLQSLDFLDLSRNKFFGGIPPNLSQLSRLSVLDLSYNNLSGKIPIGTQLQSFNASVYAGNPKLCGLPLPSKCSEGESTPGPIINKSIDTLEHEDQFITFGFYVSLILGFIVGFWGVCGSLLVNSSWRHSYFNFLMGIRDRLYVMTAVNIAKMQREFKN